MRGEAPAHSTHRFPATNKKHLLNYVFRYKEEKLDLIVLNMLLSPRFYLLLFAIIPSSSQYITERERARNFIIVDADFKGSWGYLFILLCILLEKYRVPIFY